MINLYILVFAIQCSCYILNYDDVYEFGIMSHNVYLKSSDKNWINTSLDNVIDMSIGEDTVRAYLFSNSDKSRNVVALKGTSIYFGLTASEIGTLKLNGQGTESSDTERGILSSVSNDKWNDNLFFSCCFNVQAGIKDCLCEQETVCCINCYKKSIDFEKNYLSIVKKIMNNVEKIVDINNSELIFTGHSLGGMLASYLGIIYNKLTVSFEAPGDRHYLFLSDIINKDNNYNNIYHFGHNADPIFMGNCGSTCSLMGYYMNTKCHIGNTCLYNAKEYLNYTESILNHRIDIVLKNIIPEWKDKLPECKIDNECIDCDNWVYT